MSRTLQEAIVAAPADDQPRLVFADWCEARGEGGRAEFVRVQLQRRQYPDWDVRQVALKVRERALIEQHGAKWRAELPNLAGVQWAPSFVRGWPNEARVDSFERLVEVQDDLAQVPGFSSVVVSWPASASEAQALRPIPGLRELTIERAIRDPNEPAWLAAAPFLSTVRRLHLVDQYSATPGHEPLLSSPHLTELQALFMMRANIGREGVPALVADGRLPKLTSLFLSERGSNETSWSYWDGGLTDEAMDLLATWPGLARIETLELPDNRLLGPELERLFRSPHLGARLRYLNLQGILSWGDIPWRDLGKDVQLAELDLTRRGFNDPEEFEAFADVPGLRAFRHLKISDTNFEEPSWFVDLLSAPFTSTLEVLEGRSIDMEGDDLLNCLSEASLPALHTLDVRRNWEVREASAQALVRSSVGRGLRSLSLGSARFRHPVFFGEALAQTVADVQSEALLDLTIEPMTDGGQAILRKSVLGQRLDKQGGLRFSSAPSEEA
ncbi:MAG: TIGR02996 domain-containing protein [Myxococcota bacterium]